MILCRCRNSNVISGSYGFLLRITGTNPSAET
nr:MAG TPA: hypothetical protein [Caudoviricetes sp.]